MSERPTSKAADRHKTATSLALLLLRVRYCSLVGPPDVITEEEERERARAHFLLISSREEKFGSRFGETLSAKGKVRHSVQFRAKKALGSVASVPFPLVGQKLQR